jgi:hypothetical protein
MGCNAPAYEPTIIPLAELQQRTRALEVQIENQRGYISSLDRCEGRIVFEYDTYGRAYIRCEHYNKRVNRDHLIDYSISDGSYDLDYIEAELAEDADELDRIEYGACELGFGPRSTCRTVENVSSQRVYCPRDHRDENDNLVQAAMYHLKCTCRFRIFQPLAEYRDACPYIFIISHGSHPHPIPLPSKTPPVIREEIFKWLELLREDLPDITPRRFLRHPTIKSFLHQIFPRIMSPTPSDLHVSLANRSHLRAYILRVKEQCFPAGTGWEGILLLKQTQDLKIPRKDHYIRHISEIPTSLETPHEEDDNDTESDTLRIVICMSKHSSKRLARAQYLESDIGFKRVIGFQEFELACLDRDANTTVIFCRVYLNRQSAFAHHRVFQEIAKIVQQDTGQSLRWRHLHAQSLDDYDGMILHWAVDQHGGQAKGLGLYLQELASQEPDKYDLHQTDRKLTSLSPYEHLHRVLRLCTVHTMRNIRKCNVSEDVRNLMRSLMCVRHPNWDETLQAIQEQGGKAGTDWVQNKLSSKFAFEGMCWEKSYIPEPIWRAGAANSNLIESVHEDAQREGIHCTLVGGVEKGRFFDALKEKTLKIFEDTGIRPSYQSGHPSVNSVKNLKRKHRAHHKHLMSEDHKIDTHNQKIRKIYDTLQVARARVQTLALSDRSSQQSVEGAAQKEKRALNAFEKVVEAGKDLIGTGSGKVGLLLPNIERA